jgi:hypothetical protein
LQPTARATLNKTVHPGDSRLIGSHRRRVEPGVCSEHAPGIARSGRFPKQFHGIWGKKRTELPALPARRRGRRAADSRIMLI